MDGDYTVETARQAAERDELAEWVTDFLASPGSDNGALAVALADPPRCWSGPLQLPIDLLHRLVGPPDAPVVHAVDEDDWRDDVDDLADQVDEGFEPPPVVVSHQEGQLVVEDGNHRLEALRRAGVDLAWAVVAFDSAEDRDRFVAPDPGRSGVLGA